MSSSNPPPKRNPDEPVLMDHEYDGIREYDQKLPNWWLVTLFGAIIFSAVYWFYYVQSNVGKDDRVVVTEELAAIDKKKQEIANRIDTPKLIAMSRDSAKIADGEAVFKGTCFACHGPEGKGIKGIGFNLVDNTWVHGTDPKAIYDNVMNGIKYNGAPTGMMPQNHLGPEKVASVVAFLLSKHKIEEMKSIARDEEPSQK